MKNVKTLSVALIFMLTVSSNMSAAATYFAGTTEELESAFISGINGDIVILDSGTYNPTMGFDAYLTLKGKTGSPGDVILDLSHMVQSLASPESYEGTPLTLEALTCTHYGGNSSILEGFSVVIKNCVFQDNLFYANGSRVISGSHLASLVLENSLFKRNHAPSGGGVVNIQSGDLTATGCTFTENSSMDDAGAIYFANGNINLKDCSFLSNSAAFFSGALFVLGAAGSISECNFVDNHAMAGGGAMRLLASTLSLTNTQIRKNAGYYVGAGGLEISFGSTIMMSHCEVMENESNATGIDGFLYEDSSVIFHCCVIDTEKWVLDGAVEINNDGCAVATTTLPLSSLKALYR